MVIDLRSHLAPDAGHDPRLAALYRNSAAAFESKFLDERYNPPLRVDFSQAGNLDAQAFGKLTAALQVSTARIARGLLHPSSENVRINRNDVERAPLVPLGSFGGALLFSFPKQARTDRGQESWSFDHDYTLTEAAVKELVTVLPRSLDDTASIDVLPSQALAVRSAVRTLAEAIQDTGGVRMTLTLPRADGHVESVLTAAQARGVEAALAGTHDRVTEETVKATLDGVRTARRIFYLVRPSGTEIHGSMGPELMPQIRAYLGQPVVARIQKIVQEDDAGRQRRPVYRLLSLSVDQEIEGTEPENGNEP